MAVSLNELGETQVILMDLMEQSGCDIPLKVCMSLCIETKQLSDLFNYR